MKDEYRLLGTHIQPRHNTTYDSALFAPRAQLNISTLQLHGMKEFFLKATTECERFGSIECNEKITRLYIFQEVMEKKRTKTKTTAKMKKK